MIESKIPWSKKTEELINGIYYTRRNNCSKDIRTKMFIIADQKTSGALKLSLNESVHVLYMVKYFVMNTRDASKSTKYPRLLFIGMII